MVKFECPACGQSMQTAQYLNGKGHCLKCDAVVAQTEKHPLNPEWTRKMRDKFDALNTDGKVNKGGFGTLDLEEMSALLLKGNKTLTPDELKNIFEGADTNKNGVIEFSEFLWFLYGSPSNAAPAARGGAAAAGRASLAAPSGGGAVRASSKGAAPAHRQPGEASTFKLSPSDACESEAGVCNKNDGGPHHYKFGACSYCHAPEGKLVKGSGAFAYEGGAAGCKNGGKCMYKFGKCSKCGAKEF